LCSIVLSLTDTHDTKKPQVLTEITSHLLFTTQW
jgi:hypothetical protein